ncbi:hypothetical protein D3C75_1190500 [compost metagenome]
MALQQVHDLRGELVVLSLVRLGFRVAEAVEDLLLDDEVIHGVVHQSLQHLANLGGVRLGADQTVEQLVGLVDQPAMLLVDQLDPDFEFTAPWHESHVFCPSRDSLSFFI